MSLTDPEAFATDVVLADGQTLHLRPMRPDDYEAVRAMWHRLSPETIRLRFFAPQPLDERMLRHLVEVDYVDRFALVGQLHDRIIAVARFDRLPEAPDTAEFAITVEDAQQGRGIGTVMLRALLAPARAMGISSFHGEILKGNTSMLRVMRDAGFEPAIRDYGEVVTASFTTEPTERLLERAGELDRRAARNALAAVFRPDAVAVVGASRTPDSVGAIVLSNLLRGGFAGAVYPVNPHASHVGSVAAYPTIEACPTTPDTVFVAVPAPLVEGVVEEAGRLGVRAAVLLGTGFSEAGEEGAALEARVLATARRHGIRLVGPNCMGVLNAAQDVRMNGTFAPRMPPSGRIGFSSQSGALGMAILAAARRSALGLSTFASIGNKADISSNDLLQYWEADPGTDVVVLYLESFGNPRTFARIARRVARRKPIVAVKAGRRGTDDRVVEALFEQTGVIRVPTLEQMFTVASLLASQPLPAGERVGILSNGAGPAMLAADACEANGLVLPTLPPAVAAELQATLPTLGPAGNPLTMTAATSPAQLAEGVRAVAASGAVDALLAIATPPVQGGPESFADALAEAADGLDVPLVAVVMTSDEPPEALRRAGVPCVAFPEGAADALGHAVRYSRWRQRPLGNVVRFEDVDDAAATSILSRGLAGGGDGWLGTAEAEGLLAAAGIPCRPTEGVAEGIGVTIAVEADPTFGPVLKVGLGGTIAELLGDRSVRVLPLTDSDVDDMLRQLRGWPLLVGYRGSPPVDVAALRTVLLRLAALVEAHPAVLEVGLDPVVVRRTGVDVGGARVRIRPES